MRFPGRAARRLVGARRPGSGAEATPRVGPRYDVVARTRLFEVLAPGFVAVEDRPGRLEGLVLSGYSPPAPFAAVEVTVEAADGVVLAGLATRDGDHLLGTYDPSTRQAGIELRTSGTTTVLAHGRVRGRVRRLALVVCENQPTVLVDTGSGWRPVAADRHRVAHRVDLRLPANLSRYRAAWGSHGGTTHVGLVRAGLFGMAGLRDIHLVQDADGSPYERDGRMYLTATCAGAGFFQQAHWGVFAFDPSQLADVARAAGDGADPGGAEPLELEQTAKLFSHRDGMLLGDHAGQIVRDGDVWHVAVSSWGDFEPHGSVHVRHTTTTADVLTGVHVLETELTAMPGHGGSYDPAMTRIDGRWHVAFVVSVSLDPADFHPALAVGPKGASHWSEGLELVGAAPHLHLTEGPVLARPDGPATPWRVLTSDGAARCYRVFDLAMREIGTLDAPYETNLPHPQLLDLPSGERLLVTFDGTPVAQRLLGYGTHGDVLLMRAQP